MTHSLTQHFRNEKVTAPLKLIIKWAIIFTRMPDFRNEKVTAPLKHLRDIAGNDSGSNFRNEKVTAPIEAVLASMTPCVIF